MNFKNNKYTIAALVAIPFMFVWIFITLFLTGGREIEEFTEADKMIFSGFIIAELLTLLFMIICIKKSEGINRTNNVYTKPTTSDIKPDKRRAIISVISSVSVFAVMLCGIFAQKFFNLSTSTAEIVATICLVAPIICVIINLLIKRIYKSVVSKKSLSETQQFWLVHRENTEKYEKKKLTALKRIILINDLYSIFLGVCAYTTAFCAGLSYDSSVSTSIIFLTVIVINAATSRIRLKTPSDFFDEDNCYVSEKDYPAIYALAKKAAEKIGCSRNIKIALLDDFNAGAAIINDTISIQLGVLLLNSLSEEEVFCVLLHEFSHIKNENKNQRIYNYNNFIYSETGVANPNYFSALTKHFFSFGDAFYNLQYQLYTYTVSLARESAADKAMAIYGEKEIAASSLIKIKYYDLYTWQKGTYDCACTMESEVFNTNALKDEVKNFKKIAKVNEEKWSSLIKDEILSRSASHPTLKMRLADLDVFEIKALSLDSSDEYTADCEKAIDYITSIIAEQVKESYEEQRKYYYIESKEMVEEWENNEKPVIPEEYADICGALRRLGRNTEALELCERAIELLDEPAACYGYFIKGCFLIHSFDETGIEYIYRAIENNHNYITEGLDEIGHFCCLTGQEDQLEIYRERVITLTEENEKVYAQGSVLNKKDNLSRENLPEGMLEDILSYITSEHSDYIEKIYLVRKTVTDDYFTSAFVIKMTPDTNDDTKYEILHKAFNYLDTCSDWQFSLFDYEEVKNVRIEDIDGSCVYSK